MKKLLGCGSWNNTTSRQTELKRKTLVSLSCQSSFELAKAKPAGTEILKQKLEGGEPPQGKKKIIQTSNLNHATCTVKIRSLHTLYVYTAFFLTLPDMKSDKNVSCYKKTPWWGDQKKKKVSGFWSFRITKDYNNEKEIILLLFFKIKNLNTL